MDESSEEGLCSALMDNESRLPYCDTVNAAQAAWKVDVAWCSDWANELLESLRQWSVSSRQFVDRGKLTGGDKVRPGVSEALS